LPEQERTLAFGGRWESLQGLSVSAWG